MSRELNLLPLGRRRLLKLELSLYADRRILLSLILALAIITAGSSLASASLWVLHLIAQQSMSVQLEQARVQYREERERVVKQNLVLRTMQALSRERVVWSERLPSLLQVIPPGVTIEKMFAQAGQVRQLTVSGRAANRNTLVIMNSRLEEISWIQAVTAPHSNLIERLNPEFSFTISLFKETAP